jgi:hypothetical protein
MYHRTPSSSAMVQNSPRTACARAIRPPAMVVGGAQLDVAERG